MAISPPSIISSRPETDINEGIIERLDKTENRPPISLALYVTGMPISEDIFSNGEPKSVTETNLLHASCSPICFEQRLKIYLNNVNVSTVCPDLEQTTNIDSEKSVLEMAFFMKSG